MAGNDTRRGAPSGWRLPDDHTGFMAGVFEDLASKPPYDRVLDLARLAPELKARGLPADLHDRLDLSNAGLASAQASLRPEAEQLPTIWETSPVPPNERRAPLYPWTSQTIPLLSAELLSELDKTDALAGYPPGTSRRQIAKEAGGPGVRSRVGAMGRAQVMPKTLEALNRKLGTHYDPDNDRDAVAIHRALTLENEKRFGYPWSIAAYNGGWDTEKWARMQETKIYAKDITGAPLPPWPGRRPQR